MAIKFGGNPGKITEAKVKNLTLPRTTLSSKLEGRLKTAVASSTKARKAKIVKAAVIKKFKKL